MRTFVFCALVTALCLSCHLTPVEYAPPCASRTLPDNGYSHEQRFKVEILLTGNAKTVTVNEVPPDGWIVNQVHSKGKLRDGVISWNLASLPGSKRLQYFVTPSTDSDCDAVFTGQADGIEIIGDSTLPHFIPAPGKQAPVMSDTHYDYLLYLPKTYGEEEKEWPLMMFLHGAHERGDDFKGVKKYGPPKLVADRQALNQVFGGDFNFVLVSPQCPDNEWWDNDQLSEILDEVISHYSIDTKRIYLTGFSMGGFASWSLGSAEPDRFAALAPICGGGDAWGLAKGFYDTTPDIPKAKPEALIDTPIWAFHGGWDILVPKKVQEEIVNEVKELGGDVTFTIYPRVGHRSWIRAYMDPNLYQWFLKHRLTDGK